jgi:hypothetical protein
MIFKKMYVSCRQPSLFLFHFKTTVDRDQKPTENTQQVSGNTKIYRTERQQHVGPTSPVKCGKASHPGSTWFKSQPYYSEFIKFLNLSVPLQFVIEISITTITIELCKVKIKFCLHPKTITSYIIITTSPWPTSDLG